MAPTRECQDATWSLCHRRWEEGSCFHSFWSHSPGGAVSKIYLSPGTEMLSLAGEKVKMTLCFGCESFKPLSLLSPQDSCEECFPWGTLPSALFSPGWQISLGTESPTYIISRDPLSLLGRTLKCCNFCLPSSVMFPPHTISFLSSPSLCKALFFFFSAHAL